MQYGVFLPATLELRPCESSSACPNLTERAVAGVVRRPLQPSGDSGTYSGPLLATGLFPAWSLNLQPPNEAWSCELSEDPPPRSRTPELQPRHSRHLQTYHSPTSPSVPPLAAPLCCRIILRILLHDHFRSRKWTAQTEPALARLPAGPSDSRMRSAA